MWVFGFVVLFYVWLVIQGVHKVLPLTFEPMEINEWPSRRTYITFTICPKHIGLGGRSNWKQIISANPYWALLRFQGIDDKGIKTAQTVGSLTQPYKVKVWYFQLKHNSNYTKNYVTVVTKLMHFPTYKFRLNAQNDSHLGYFLAIIKKPGVEECLIFANISAVII